MRLRKKKKKKNIKTNCHTVWLREKSKSHRLRDCSTTTTDSVAAYQRLNKE